jgi:tetratricopeptide (TPR) repeat protein
MPPDSPNAQGPRIDSWKEIAAFFGRDERTVKRWERQRGLPVHRVPGGARGTVYAFTEELTAWLRSSQQRESQEPPLSLADKTSLTGGKFATAPLQQNPLASAQLPAPIAAPPATTTPFAGNSSSRWLAATALAVVIVALLAFPRFYELRSVQGRAMPAISRRTESAKHLQAEDLYLQGRYYWNKRTPDGLTLALDDFTKAAQLDPNYALAYAGQADCYNLLREYTSMPASQAFPLAISAAKKSLELDDVLPEGHRALGFAYFYWNWDLAGGEREFRRAIALNPNDVEARHWYATALLSVARYPEALAQIERARQLDPSSPSIAADRAVILFSSGRQDEAIQILLDLEKSEPSFLSPYKYLAGAYFDRKEYLKSFDQSERAAQIARDQKTIAAIASAKQQFQSAGESAMLQQMLADQIQGFAQGNTKALEVAKTYSLLGQNKEALAYLEKAYQLHEYELITIVGAPAFRNLRPDPQFQDLLHRLGLSIPYPN